jgi:hypothetical protein
MKNKIMNNQNDNKKFELVEIHPDLLNDIDRHSLEDADWNLLVAMGQDASRIKTYTQWILGKLGNAVAKKYGDLKQYADEINQKYEVLNQYVYTYRKFIQEDPSFHPGKYAGSIPWGMLQLAASKSDSPQKLVEDLQDKGIHTINHAYKEIKEQETGIKIPQKPKVNLYWNPELRKFKISLNPDELDLIDWTDVKNQLMNYLEALE